MATDIFGSTTQIGGAWKLDGAVLTIEGGQDLVAQTVALSYQRQVTKVDPVNQDKKYLISGDPQGTVQIGAVIGPSKSIKTFLERYADICQASGNTLTIKPSGVSDCEGDSTPVEFICSGCILTGIGMNISKTAAGNLVIASVAMDIMSLEVK